METSINTIGKLALALAKAQSQIPPIKKDKKATFPTKKGGQMSYAYADLSTILEAVKMPLTKNELSISQTIDVVGQMIALRTVLMHSSGEHVESLYPLPNPSSTKPQDMGSAITYARRYSLSAIVGISADEDDDGQRAQDNDQQKTTQPAKQNLDPNFVGWTKGKNAGKSFESVGEENVKQWIDYMTQKGFTKGVDFQAAVRWHDKKTGLDQLPEPPDNFAPGVDHSEEIPF